VVESRFKMSWSLVYYNVCYSLCEMFCCFLLHPGDISRPGAQSVSNGGFTNGGFENPNKKRQKCKSELPEGNV
jgi:hypothetical protein